MVVSYRDGNKGQPFVMESFITNRNMIEGQTDQVSDNIIAERDIIQRGQYTDYFFQFSSTAHDIKDI